MRYLVLFVGLLPGCQPSQQTVPTLPVEQLTLPSDTGFPEPAEFSGWESVTTQPVFVGRGIWGLCRNLTPEEAKVYEEDTKQFGLHMHRQIRIRVNMKGLENFRSGKVMPIGSVVVKEKHAHAMLAYALMIKRETGYDPEHGDWQYVYVDAYAKPSLSEGKLNNCIHCHQGAKDSDYLFKFYLNKKPVNENEHEAGLK